MSRKPLAPPNSATSRLVQHAASKGWAVTVLHVRRVGGQQIEWPVDTVQIGCRDELDSVRDAMTYRIPLRHHECIRRDVGCDDAAIGQFSRKSDGHASAPGADVAHATRSAPRGDAESSTAHERQRLFDDELGFRARNQYGRGRFEVETPEFSDADDVGRWFVTLATCDPFGEPRLQAARAEGPADPRAVSRDPSSGWCRRRDRRRWRLRPEECRRRPIGPARWQSTSWSVN